MILPNDVIEAVAVALFENDDKYRNIFWRDLRDEMKAAFRSDAHAVYSAILKTHDIVERRGVPGLTHEEWLEARNALTKCTAVSVASQNPPERIGNEGCVSPNGINLAAGQVWSVALRRRKIVDFDGPKHTPISYRSNGSLYWTSKIEFLAWITRTGATLQEPR